jgi:hypothetical protein
LRYTACNEKRYIDEPRRSQRKEEAADAGNCRDQQAQTGLQKVSVVIGGQAALDRVERVSRATCDQDRQ